MPELDLAGQVAKLIEVLLPIAPWAGGFLTICAGFFITREKPHQMVNALANLLWGWRWNQPRE